MRRRFPNLAVSIHFVPDPVALLPHQAETAFSFSQHTPSFCVSTAGPTFRIVLVASDDYLSKHGEPSSLDELKNHNIVAWRPPEGFTGLPLREGGHYAVEPSCLHDDIALLREMARQGLGLVWVPIVTPLEAKMRVVLEDQLLASVTLRIVVPKIFQSIPRVVALLEILVNMTGIAPLAEGTPTN